MTRVLVTGGSGFVGSALIDKISRDERFEVCTSVRDEKRYQVSGPIGSRT